MTKPSERCIPYWPYCETCRQPFDFDPESPHAYCNCGSTEWGDPRPHTWIPKPIAPEGEQPTEWRVTDRFGQVSYIRNKEDAEFFAAQTKFKVEPLFEHPQAAKGAQAIHQFRHKDCQDWYDACAEELPGLRNDPEIVTRVVFTI